MATHNQFGAVFASGPARSGIAPDQAAQYSDDAIAQAAIWPQPQGEWLRRTLTGPTARHVAVVHVLTEYSKADQDLRDSENSEIRNGARAYQVLQLNIQRRLQSERHDYSHGRASCSKHKLGQVSGSCGRQLVAGSPSRMVQLHNRRDRKVIAKSNSSRRPQLIPSNMCSGGIACCQSQPGLQIWLLKSPDL